MKSGNKIFKEVLIIFFISLMVGLVANKISSKGIPLLRDDSDRFAIDTNVIKQGEGKQPEKVLTKEGFVKPQNITVEIAKKLFDENVIFIDGREPHEFAEGHIKGSINISYKEFIEKSPEERQKMMGDLDKEKTIVSYCGGGDCEISIDNAYEMAKIGYNDIKIYLGGYLEWNELGYPVNK
ncbi:MAG: rhodanese-like domain-containing protein [Ignavibacteria bacterium]